MAMTASAIRFEPNEKEWIAAFAEKCASGRSNALRTNLMLGTFRKLSKKTMARVFPGARSSPISGWRFDWAIR